MTTRNSFGYVRTLPGGRLRASTVPDLFGRPTGVQVSSVAAGADDHDDADDGDGERDGHADHDADPGGGAGLFVECVVGYLVAEDVQDSVEETEEGQDDADDQHHGVALGGRGGSGSPLSLVGLGVGLSWGGVRLWRGDAWVGLSWVGLSWIRRVRLVGRSWGWVRLPGCGREWFWGGRLR